MYQTPPQPDQPCECGRGQKIGVHTQLTGRWMWFPCEACKADRAREEREEAERKAAAEAKQRLEYRAENVGLFLERMGVTRKYHGVTLGSFIADTDAKALAAAQGLVEEFLNGDRPSLYLYSVRPGEAIAPGCGKTHLAVAALAALILNPDVPLDDLGFCFVPRMLLEIQSTFKHPERSELSVVKKYSRPELLVWDDFGAEKLSDYAARTLYTILYEREGKSNIFTSNLSLGEIEARDPSGYTQRITSRIAGDSRIIRMVGPDRRLHSRAA